MASITGTNGLPKDYAPVTPNNSTNNLPSGQIIGFYVVGGGNIVITNSAGVDRTLTVGDLSFTPFVGATRVKSTGTTATGINALVG